LRLPRIWLGWARQLTMVAVMSYEIQVTSDEFALVGICNPDLASRLCHGFAIPTLCCGFHAFGWDGRANASQGKGRDCKSRPAEHFELQVISYKIQAALVTSYEIYATVFCLAGFVIPPSSWPRLPRIWVGWTRQRIARVGIYKGLGLQIPTSGGGRRELITHHSSLVTHHSSLKAQS